MPSDKTRIDEMKHPQLVIVYDDETRKYYSYRPDDPSNPYHEITLGGMLFLDREMVRIEHDGWHNKMFPPDPFL